jgi:S-DNA-T family DNA segregation ATPase FtsK/SpoIIIE
VHVARPARGLVAEVEAIAARAAPARAAVPTIGALPREVAVADLLGHVALGASPQLLPVGMSERTLSPVGFTLYPGEHALVTGPARSGKTTALAVTAMCARSVGWRTAVIAGPRSPLCDRHDLGSIVRPGDLDVAALDRLLAEGSAAGGLLALVDDAETVDDEGRVLPDLMSQPGVVVLAAGRADTLRGLYTHWTRRVRASRAGLLLQPDVDLDGELLSVRLPRRSTTALTVGRGYLCCGPDIELVQVARPDGGS